MAGVRRGRLTLEHLYHSADGLHPIEVVCKLLRRRRSVVVWYAEHWYLRLQRWDGMLIRWTRGLKWA